MICRDVEYMMKRLHNMQYSEQVEPYIFVASSDPVPRIKTRITYQMVINRDEEYDQVLHNI